MSTENQEVSVEPAAEEKTETKEVKGTKRAAEVSICTQAIIAISTLGATTSERRNFID